GLKNRRRKEAGDGTHYMVLCACTFQFVERFANRGTRVTCQHEVGVGGFSGGDTLRENDVISIYNYFLIIAVDDDQVCHCCSLSFVGPQFRSQWVRSVSTTRLTRAAS